MSFYDINLQKTGIRFNRNWIFRNLELQIKASEKWVITGSNGSGKSTLLQMISGRVWPSEGKISFIDSSGQIADQASIYKLISMAAPYIELIEEFDLLQLTQFVGGHLNFLDNRDTEEIINLMGLPTTGKKAIKHFSSGMKQRVKLTYAIMADRPVLLLDEPCSNLDGKAIEWYQKMIDQFARHKSIIVCSNNQREEYPFCTQEVNTSSFQQK